MENVFLKLLNMSISACWLVLAVVVIRLLLKNAPKFIRCILWAIVGLKLICPFSFESVFSVLPKGELIPEHVVQSNSSFEPTLSEVFEYAQNNPVVYDIGLDQNGSITFTEFTAPDSDYLNPLLILSTIASVAWLVGLMVMLAYGIISYLKLRKKTAASLNLRDNIWLCDDIQLPFILGLIRPRIFVPSYMSEEQLSCVEAHERAHLERRDHWWKPLGYAVLAVHWFNPAIWLAYILLCRDIELACDEKVIKSMSMGDKKDYSRVLLSCNIPHRSISACPLAFGEVGVKERVKTVLNYKKPALWIIIAAVVACIVAALCFLTEPIDTKIDKETEAYLHTVILEQGRSEHTEQYFPCEDHIILKAEKEGAVTTVYALVRYAEYSYTDGIIKEESGFHCPAVITLDMEGYGYSSNCWWPGDGSEYAPSIREHFPRSLWSKAINIHKYSDEQSARCRLQAEQYYMLGGAAETDIGQMNIGAQLPTIVFADRHTVILNGTFGLLVYDTDANAIVHLISYEKLGTIGIDILEAIASSDGSLVYLANHTGTGLEFTRVLDVKNLTISEYSGGVPKDRFVTEDLFSKYGGLIEAKNRTYIVNGSAVTIDGSILYVRADRDWSMSSLQIVWHNLSTDEMTVRDVFPESKRVVPSLDSFIGEENLSKKLEGYTFNDLVAAWGEPIGDGSITTNAAWSIENTDYIIYVSFEEGNGAVVSAQMASRTPLLQD